MRRWIDRLTACGLALACVGGVGGVATEALAQKSGGTLRVYHRDNPPSASIHEEATNSTVIPFMSVFNNLVLYDQGVAQNSMESIRPDLADSWTWNADKSKLTMKLHAGVAWHDGKPFTAKDVACTFDLLTGKAEAKLRRNPRSSWYTNLDRVEASGDLEAVFHLKRPQPSFIALLASGYTPIYPCHVPAAQMRTKPVGTGPFKFVEFKPNEGIKLARNPDYWKKGRPYLDAIEYTIIPNRSTAMLAFQSGRIDLTFPWEVTIPLMKDIKTQAPTAVCQVSSMNNSVNLIVNRDKPPFDNPDIRKAMLLALDRKAFVDILNQGNAQLGGTMAPLPDGVWGMPQAMLDAIPGYGPDVAKNREEARAIMRKAGYGPDKRLPVKVAARNIALYRDPAVIFADQIKEVYFDAELDVIDTSAWFVRVGRKDYAVGLNTTGNGIDDPDQNYFENFACGSERNYTGYCNREIEPLFAAQSVELDADKRKRLVWEIDRKLLEDGARPIVMWNSAATCHQAHVKGYVAQVNSVYNGFRFEDVWLDK